MNITQQLGFDVSNALSNLSKLDSAIDKHVGQLGKLSVAYDKLNTSPRLGNASAAIDQLAARTQSAASKISQSTNSAAAGFERLGSQNLSGLTQRVLTANLLSRGIANLSSALTNSVGDSIDFQRSLAEIQTIAPALQGDIDALGKSVRQLSDEFNAQLGDVSEGLYQTISNQVQGTSNQFDVLTTALKFSKAAVTSTDQSVQLLTAAINGFGLEASDSETIAAKLFKTIELGRTRASELSNSLGRVAKIGDQVGVSLDEVLASLATITISGVKTSEAITQLRGVFTGLIKPTERMSDALLKLGFTSGEQAIKILGFKDTLDALVDSTGGSTDALAELFPRVRGLSGVLSVATKAAGKFDDNLDKIRRTTNETLNRAYNIVIETDAEKATKRINELKNLLTDEFGTSAVRAFNQATGAADKLGEALGSLPVPSGEALFSGVANAAPAATAALLAYAIQTRGAALATTALGVSAGSLVGRLGGLSTALFGVVAASSAMDAALETALREAREGFDQIIKSRAEEIKRDTLDRIRAEEKVWDETLKTTKDGISEQLREFNRRNASIAKSSETLSRRLQASVSDIFSSRQNIVGSFVERAQQAQNQQAQVGEQIADLRIESADSLFQRSLRNLTPIRQFNQLLARSAKLGQDATEALDLGEKTSSDDLFRRATALERQASQIADQLGSNRHLAQSERVLVALTKQRSDALERFSSQQKVISQQAEQAATAQRESLNALKAQFAELGQGPDLFDDRGNPFSREQRAKNLAAFNAQLDAFRESALNLDLGFSELIDLSRFESEIKRSLDNLSGDTFKFGDVTSQLDSQLDAFFANKQVTLAIDAVVKSGGKTITDPSQIFSGFQAARRNATNRIRLGGEISALQLQTEASAAAALTEIGNAAAASNNLVRQLQHGLGQVFRLKGKGTVETMQAMATATKTLEETLADGVVTSEELTNTLSALDAAVLKFNANSNFTPIDPLQIDAVKKARVDLNALFEAQQQLEKKKSELNELEPVKVETSVFDALKAKAEASRQVLSSGADELLRETGAVVSNISSGISRAQELARALDAAANSASTIKVGPIQDNPFVNRAAGGHVRGRDNVLASLSAGEHVTSARNTRRFAAELQAINAGITPAFRSSGGVVNNTTVGDVNVTVDGSNGPSAAANDIARQLRRSIRQGVSRF